MNITTESASSYAGDLLSLDFNNLNSVQKELYTHKQEMFPRTPIQNFIDENESEQWC